MNSSKDNFLPPERINEKLQKLSCRFKIKCPHLLPVNVLRRRVQAQRYSERPGLFFIAGLCSWKVEQVEINVSRKKHQVITTRADWGSSDECFEVRKWPHWDMTPHWKQWKPGPSILHYPFHFSIQKYQCLNFSCKRIQVEMLSSANTAQHKNCFFFSFRFCISNIVWITLFLLFMIWKYWPLWLEFPRLNCELKFLSWCL